MIKTTLIWVFVAMIAAVLLLFFINGGGYSAIVRTAQSFPTLKELILGTASSSTGFQLPGQGDMFNNLGVDVIIDATDTPEQSYTAPAPSEIRQESSAPVYANSSPYSGHVSLEVTNAYGTDASSEYLTLIASTDNAGPLDISGWSLQSMVSGKRIYIPLAASPFVLGIVNRVSDALLEPGAPAVIVSGVSPVGVSFQETVCTGYLNQTQTFTPALSNSCPARDRVLPYNAENLARFGADCFDYIQSMPQCDFPKSVPSSLSASCRALLSTAFSYNGCVDMFQSSPDFALPSWRMYAGFTTEVWGNLHDIIRLMDGQGRIIDTVSY